MLGMCFALALQGVAQAGALERPCPMNKPGHQQAAHKVTSAHQPCNDSDSVPKASQSCKTCLACPAAAAWFASSQQVFSFPRAAVSLVSSPEPLTVSAEPGGRWRPPTLI
jgi:hypothetical protein